MADERADGGGDGGTDEGARRLQGRTGPVVLREVTALDGPARTAVDAVDGAVARTLGAPALDEAGRRHLEHRGLEGARLWLAEEPHPGGDPRPVGVALLRRTGAEHDLTLAVTPEEQGYGVGAALARTSVDALADDARVVAWSHVDSPRAAHLAERLGFDRVRELLVMEREPGGLPALPERGDVEIRAYRPSDEADLLAVNAAAFAHHPEQGAMDARDLAERMAQDWFDPAGLLVAEDVETGAMLGFHWTKTTPSEGSGPVGEVYVVGVAPQAQGRGLGKLLTLAGLHHLEARRPRVVELYVEGDNHPARAVYAGLGFTVAASHVQYARG
ncbi:mycothiol synthase [Nocardioides sp. CPCC 205120]|uniref:mycothiol synthase n=1 Tax=Nocardioides sp. CPCC 205120 TaxID=3406462 RepID=UPI003B50F85D